MTQTKQGNNPDLDGWNFLVEEVSAGVYRVEGHDAKGRSVERTGTDPEEILESCRRDAIIMDCQ